MQMHSNLMVVLAVFQDLRETENLLDPCLSSFNCSLMDDKPALARFKVSLALALDIPQLGSSAN